MDSDIEQDIATFWGLLFRIVADGEKRLAAHMAAHDLTPPQFYVLKTLMENSGQCAIGLIARQHHLTNATMTGLVNRLEAMGLVQRERNAADMRSITVVLTDAGRQRFLDVQESLISQLRVLMELVTPEDRRSLIHFLSRYVNIVTQLLPVENISP